MSILQGFLRTLAGQAGFFEPGRPVTIARAPGRLDVMGGIADYSGSLVLQLPIAAAAFAAAQWSSDGRVTVLTTAPDAAGGSSDVSLPLADLLADYAAVREMLARDPARHWAAYVAGAITVLRHERRIALPHGVRVLIASDVPAGKGVGSSAAIEVAAMQAVCSLADLPMDGREMALLCQKVENLVVGAPCGVMDQMTAVCGEANALLALLCQPAELQPPVALPGGIELYGIDSGIRHAVSGADYTSVRVGAFMGYRIIAELAGLPVTIERGRARIDDARWRGYLANVTPDEWAETFRDRMPETMTGAAFLDAYGGFSDTVTTIDPGRTYAVRIPTAHPIHEHERVRRFREILTSAPLPDHALVELGELMFASHASYSACGLGSDGTDEIVRLVLEAGPLRGLFGAKITGGGSGGTVAVLAGPGCRQAVDQIAAGYSGRSGRLATVIAGSSDGAVRFGTGRTK